MVERPVTTNSKCKDLMIAYSSAYLWKIPNLNKKLVTFREKILVLFLEKKFAFLLHRPTNPPFEFH